MSFAAFALLALATASQAAPIRPHLLFILVDDLGYA